MAIPVGIPSGERFGNRRLEEAHLLAIVRVLPIAVLVGLDLVAVGAEDLGARVFAAEDAFDELHPILAASAARAPLEVSIAIDVVDLENSGIVDSASNTAPAELLKSP